METLARLDRILAGGAPDVLVTDVILPDGDGIDHIRGVAERFPALPIIVLSAQNTLTTAVRARQRSGRMSICPNPSTSMR